jgi:hypothetical protein
MAEYSRIAKGHFTSTGGAQIINLPFQPDFVEFFNYTAANTAATSQNIVSGEWDVSMGQGTAVIQGYNATPALIYDTVTTGGISTFSAGQLLQYGPTQTLGASGGIVGTSSTTTTITTTTAHGLSTGNVVIFQNLYQTATTGMNQLAGIPFSITVTSPTTFTIAWNATGSNYATLVGSSGALPAAGSFKQVLYPYLYEPGIAIISAINTSTNTITTTDAHNYVVGQEIAFRIPAVWGSTQLNSLPNGLTPGSPIYYYVSAVTEFTFTVTASLAAVTAFNANQLFAGNFTLAQSVAVGDVNTGGEIISAGSPLYPSPMIYGSSGLSQVPTINGPAIRGAFVNNTSQGFIIGSGAGTVLTTGSLVGANTNVIYWRAFLSDLAVN